MLINFTYKDMPAFAYVAFNFNQVSDAVLLMTFTEKYQKHERLILIYADGQWQDHSKESDGEFLQVINEQLSNIFKIENLNSHFVNNIVYNSLLSSVYCS